MSPATEDELSDADLLRRTRNLVRKAETAAGELERQNALLAEALRELRTILRIEGGTANADEVD